MVAAMVQSANAEVPSTLPMEAPPSLGAPVGVVPDGSKKKAMDGHDAMGDGNPLPHPPFQPVGKEPTLSLADLELLALQNNPTLVQAAMQVEASRAKSLQARLWPNPTVGYVGEQIGLKGTAGEFQGGFVQQEIITAFKRKLSGEKYSQQARTAEFKAALQQLKVLNGVRMQFFRTLAAGRMARTRQALSDNAIEELRTTLELFNIGRKDKAEVLMAENRRNRARMDAVTQKNHYELRWRELAALVGVPDLGSTPLLDCLEENTPALDWQGSLARILEESPELMIARSHIAFEELSLRRERRQPIPNITVKGSAGYNAEAKENVAAVEVSMPLPVWNLNQGNVRMVQADLSRSIAELRRIELSLQKRLAMEFNDYQNALFAVRMYQQENIGNAKKAYEIYLDQYKTRRVGWEEVVHRHREWLNVEMEYTHSLMQLRVREALITGLLVEDGLTAPEGPTPTGHIQVSPQPR